MLAASLFALPRGSLRVRTPSDVEELLQLANDHIGFTLHTFDREDLSSTEDQGVDGVYYVESTGHQSSTWSRLCRRLWGWLTAIFRKKKQYLHSDCGGDERFRRLKRRFTGLVHHVKDLDASRVYLSRVLHDLHDSGKQLHDAVRDAFEGDGDVTTAPSHEICAAAFNDLAVQLEENVAASTLSKLEHLERFGEYIRDREDLKHDVDAAYHKLRDAQEHSLSRNTTTNSDELLALEREFQRLRRRLSVTTAALERVFEFFERLDAGIADPELELVRRGLSDLFAHCAATYE